MMSEQDTKYVYLGRDLDGLIFAACADMPHQRAEVLDFVTKVIRDGGDLERMTVEAFGAIGMSAWGKPPFRLHPEIEAEE